MRALQVERARPPVSYLTHLAAAVAAPTPPQFCFAVTVPFELPFGPFGLERPRFAVTVPFELPFGSFVVERPRLLQVSDRLCLLRAACGGISHAMQPGRFVSMTRRRS